MDSRRVKSLHVVEGDRRIDEEAEQSRAHEVPERNRHKEINRPLVGSHPDLLLTGPRQTDVLPGLKADQYQRNNFKRAEDRTQRQHDIGSACKVKMMESSDDSARQIDNGGKQRGAGRSL